MKLTISSAGARVQHFQYWLAIPVDPTTWYNFRELVIPPFAQATAADDLNTFQITTVTTQLRAAGYVTLGEVVVGSPPPGTYAFG